MSEAEIREIVAQTYDDKGWPEYGRYLRATPLGEETPNAGCNITLEACRRIAAKVGAP